MVGFLFFALGSIFGSFLSLVAMRLEEGRSIVFPPSYCVSCHKKIKFYDLVPVLSFILLKGRCRECGARISSLNFWSEVSLGLGFLVAFLVYGLSLDLILVCITLCLLDLMAQTDLISESVFTMHLDIFLVLCLINTYFIFSRGEFSYMLALVQLVFFVLALVLSKLKTVPIGEGDLMIFAGAFGFFSPLMAFYFFAISFWLAAIYALYMIFLRKKDIKKLSFVPFIYLSFIISLVLKVVI